MQSRRSDALTELVPYLLASGPAAAGQNVVFARSYGVVPGITAISAVTLIGDASLGPEKVLGSIGGGALSWASGRRNVGDEDSEVDTLASFAGAYGGLFSSAVIVVMILPWKV